MQVRASFTDLPQEIIDLIIPRISPKDYASCVGVSPSWSTIFTPSLWKVFRLVDRTMHECFGSREARNALARNCGYIRTIETTDPAFVSFLGIFLPGITNLESLTLRLKEHPFSTVSEFILSSDFVVSAAKIMGRDFVDIPRCVTPVIKILQKNRNLRSLSLDWGCFRYKNGDEGFPELVSAFPTTHLEKLELSFLNAISHDRDIHDGSDKNLDLVNVARFNQSFQQPFLALKELSITGGSQNSMDHNRLVFLSRCPNLETLRLHRLDFKALEVLPACLDVACHKLSSLEWRKSLYDSDEEIRALIQTTKLGWRELRLPDMSLLGSFAFAALMESIETLEVLRIESAEELELNAFVDVLCSARNLRRLEGIVDRQRKRFTTEVMMHAHQAYLEHINGGMDRSWALGPKMEHFQLRIEGVPRPDVLYFQSGKELVAEELELNPAARFDVQRLIYTQLGRMTGLQELILGLQDLSTKMMRFIGVDSSMDVVAQEEAALKKGIRMFNYSSLEFSLESGLDLLADMKEMRMLDVRSTAHYIGVEELEWMHKHWPKLERIRGLDTDRRWSEKRDEGPAAKTAVDAWMAAHPRGIGFSFYS
ncbi:hypothetical protein BGZ96_003772 [Linnemannia gamsii]|uniref:F-box domain-containing protein n=1 Tax=Linnemannia gamsii TaxID=64522 RepID=A0ABQ7JIU8_9FUNG|nr:hypothetical protein BGZ96_003772 [Linnemannia gamsii]